MEEHGRRMAELESTAELERAQLGMPGCIISLYKPSHLKCLISASHHK